MKRPRPTIAGRTAAPRAAPMLHSGLVEKREDWWPVHRDPHLPPPYDAADMAALKNLRTGEASPEQQKRALYWILAFACAKESQPYVPGDPIATHVALGKRTVALFITEILNRPMPGPPGEDG